MEVAGASPGTGWVSGITYDRRGFGRSDKPIHGYTYDTLTDDLHALLEQLDLTDVTLVGLSMGSGEVARYFSLYGGERVRSVVFASAVTPYLMQTPGNPDGPLTAAQAAKMTASLTKDKDAFFDQFATDLYSADGQLTVTEQQRQEAVALAEQADKKAALACMAGHACTPVMKTSDISMTSRRHARQNVLPIPGPATATRSGQNGRSGITPEPWDWVLAAVIGLGQQRHELREAFRRVADAALGHQLALGVDDGDVVMSFGPVDAAEHLTNFVSSLLFSVVQVPG